MTDPRINHVRFTVEARDGYGNALPQRKERFDVVFPVRSDDKEIHDSISSAIVSSYERVIGNI